MSVSTIGERLELRSEVEILAEPDEVWNALLDLPGHGRWNPLWTWVRGRIEPESTVVLELCPPGGKTLRVRRTIRVFEPARELSWSGPYGWGWLLRSDQVLRLTGIEAGRTRLVVAENLRGPGVTSDNRTTLNIARGQALMNQALKRYLESSAGAGVSRETRSR
jgi:hypothetical protein